MHEWKGNFKAALEAVDTPVLIADWEQVRANVAKMAARCREAGVALMPHMKTHKSVAVARLQLEAGAVGLTCAKPSEAMAMLPSGVRKIFLAHSLASRRKIDLLRQLAAQLDELIVAATSVSHAARLARLIEETGFVLPCLLAFDTGLDREGARDLEDLAKMKKIVDAAPSLAFRGIYSHEGHGYMTSPDRIAAEVRTAAGRLRSAKAFLGEEGELWPGCSVTAFAMAEESGITGVRPGAYVFGDLLLTRITRAMPEKAAALVVAATVVDKPREGLALIDAGSKVFSSDRLGDKPMALPLDGRAFGLTRLSEEHGFLTGEQVDELNVGEVVALIPWHVCPVVNLMGRMLAWEPDRPLREIDVEARGCVY